MSLLALSTVTSRSDVAVEEAAEVELILNEIVRAGLLDDINDSDMETLLIIDSIDADKETIDLLLQLDPQQETTSNATTTTDAVKAETVWDHVHIHCIVHTFNFVR